MGIDIIENVCTLLVVIVGTLYSLFKYIMTPKRGWLYVSVFFLTHLLSDYYWTTYTLVIGENPNVSAFMAYFGWNVGYLFLCLAALKIRPDGAKKFFHPMMLLPIPLGIWQFFIYIQFGGIFNNIWEGFFAISIACICMQVILYYFKNKKDGAYFPKFHVTALFFIIFEYGMWTSSCFDWSGAPFNPYYAFSFLECASLFLLALALSRDYEEMGISRQTRSVQETRFAILLQITVSVIIFFGGMGGCYAGILMKRALPAGDMDSPGYRNIAITLFVISIFLVIFVLLIILMTALRYKSIEREMPEDAAIRRGRFNFILTLIITFSLMIISVIYTSRLFYQVAVTGVMEDGEGKVYSTSEDLENYLGVARSILWVTADTVDIMRQNGASQEKILEYLTRQTQNQAQQFDENFTGLYAYIDGEYMDGSGWVPPDDYNVEARDWYKEAVDAGGKTIIVNPYVDAQTGSVVITICKLLSDGGKEGDYSKREVVALDMIVNYVAEVIKEVSIGGKGYGLVVNEDGMIIAHHDPGLTGSNVNDIYGERFMNAVVGAGKENSSVKAILDGQDYTLFVNSVINQWYVIIAISDKELLAETNRQLYVNILVSLVIFLMISFFYYLGYKNEQLNAKKMEEMRSTDMRHEYEAQVLKQKEAAANDANKAKSQFLAQMSHEIRTPINAVLGMNEMILRSSADEEIMEYSRNIDSAGNTLLALINTILDFSKIEDGKMDIIRVNYDTSSFIYDLINSVSQRADAKGLELIPDIDETIPGTLFGDDVRLTQVIMNLLTNAVKYTEKGSVRLTIKNEGIENGMIRLYVSVKDTGIGIKPEDMGRLTLSFQRLDEKKNRNIEGTGLGMSIVSNLLSLMGSKICVESVYGEGSNFYFTIEQGVVDETPIGDFKKNLESKKVVRSDDDFINAPAARVLVVDDNNLNLLVALNLLKLCKITPDAVVSGTETIDRMSRKTYDIVFLDHMMPGMDGIETLEELKQRNLIPPATKMVVLTANAVVGAKDDYLAKGFDDYLSKPIELHALVDILKKYLPESSYVHKESVEEVREKPAERTASAPMDDGKAYNTGKLKAAGLDIDTGIEYCADLDTYFEMLDCFIDDYAGKKEHLEEHFTSKNWHDYEVLIHGLKGNLRTIGMEALAEKALALEKACKSEDATFIIEHHAQMMEDYTNLKENLCDAKRTPAGS